MNKKITRRAVLGTIIGGLAVAPFLIRAARRGQNVLPFDESAYHDPEDMQYLLHNGYRRERGNFFEQWRQVYAKFDAVCEEDDTNDSVTLRLDFSSSKSWGFRHLLTHVLDDISSLSGCTPQNMSSYELSEGTISVGNGILSVSVNKRERMWYGITEAQQDTPRVHIEQLETGKFSVGGKRDDGLFRPIDRNGHEITTEKGYGQANYPVMLAQAFLPLVTYPYPENRRLKTGDLISIPQEEVLVRKVLPKLNFDGSVRVNDTKLARFTSAGEVVTQDSSITKHRTVDFCVDLSTGLTVIKQEFEATKYSNNIAFDASTFVSVFQIS